MQTRIAILSFLAACLSALVSGAGEPTAASVQMLATPDGTKFAVLGDKPSSPAPTLLVFGGARQETLLSPDVNRIGALLADQGYLSVSLDIPCHGEDVRPGEEAGLTTWRDRIVNGDDLMGPFTKNVSRVIDHLIAEHYTDPQQIAISGTSRGGFCAMHAAAADERVRCVLAFAPVTHLPVLREFEGARDNPDVLKLSTIHLVDKLANRSIWITIGNDDVRVGSTECIDMGRALIDRARGKVVPIPIELHIVGTIDHRLHARAAPEYRQFTSPHDEAAVWLSALLAAQ